MTQTTSTAAHTFSNEFWTTTSSRGSVRYWKFSPRAFRAIPVPRAEAEFKIATGAAFLISKPAYVGR